MRIAGWAATGVRMTGHMRFMCIGRIMVNQFVFAVIMGSAIIAAAASMFMVVVMSMIVVVPMVMTVVVIVTVFVIMIM